MSLAIVANFRDEAQYLPEWIEFHKLMGVSKFYLREHVSTEGLKVLSQYIDQGLVVYTHDSIETNFNPPSP